MKRVYICGPMRGIPYYNFPAFMDAEDQLAAAGYTGIVNPARIDVEQCGFDPRKLPEYTDWNAWPEDCGEIRAVINRDLFYLVQCDIICLLDGWMESVGAKAEGSVALWAGLKARTLKQLVPADPVRNRVPEKSILNKAHSLVHGDRGKAYDKPLRNFERTAQIWQGILGIEVAPQQVGLCMIGVKLAREAFTHTEDNLVDMAGYAETVSMIEAESGTGE